MEFQTTESPSKQQERIQHDDVEIISNIIERVKQLEGRIRIGKVFQRIHEQMVKGVSYREILDETFEKLKLIIPYERIGIALVDSDRQNIKLAWVKSKHNVTFLPESYSAPLKGSSLQKIMTSGQTRVLNDLEEYLREHPDSKSTQLILKDGIRSSLTCPLLVDGVPIGVIFFSSAQKNTYKDLHIDLFCEISNGLSLLVEQALLKKNVNDVNMKERALRDTIHDLKNPLGIIQGFIGEITEEPWFENLDPEAKSIFTILERNSRMMLNLIDNFLQIYQIRGRSDLKVESVDLNSFLNDLLKNSQILGKSKSITVQLHKTFSFPQTIEIDPMRIMQAIENLVNNAVKFSQPETNITISVSFFGATNRLEFSVSDQGPGIPEEELSKLFKEFAKTSVSEKERVKGSGLGLSVVKRIVQAHGGDVFVQSKVGAGSTFGFWVPYLSSSTVH
jgi:hypothetical protein